MDPKLQPVFTQDQLPLRRTGDATTVVTDQNRVLRNTYWLLALSMLPTIAGAWAGMQFNFIALFKDSSIVSVIAMVELTKTYSILAATTLRYFELGVIVAILYFGMSYPLSLLARSLERRLTGRG